MCEVRMRFTVFILMLLSGSNLPQAAPSERLRTAELSLARLVERGRNGSATFRQLLERLESGDWIVFLQRGKCPDRATIACVAHIVGRFQGQPYLRVLIDRDWGPRDEMIASIAHELQHVHEIITNAARPDTVAVRDAVEAIAESRFRTGRMVTYETALARRTGRTVFRELRRSR
jgi:hypothetical protein